MIQCIRLQTTGLLWLRLLLLLSSYPGKLACFDRGATDLFANCMAWVMGILSALCRCGSVNEDNNNNQYNDKENNNNKERFAHNLHGFVLVLSAGVDLLLWEELSHHWPHISICIIAPLPICLPLICIIAALPPPLIGCNKGLELALGAGRYLYDGRQIGSQRIGNNASLMGFSGGLLKAIDWLGLPHRLFILPVDKD